MIKEKHFVIFESPGTFFSETSEKPIKDWYTKRAAKMAQEITERHGATPYGFRFETRLVSDAVDDGRGGTMEVEQKITKESGRYLFGHLENVDQIAARKKREDEILLFNMRANDYPIVVVHRGSFKSVQPFNKEDFLVDKNGAVVQRGDDPELVAYRKRKVAEHRK